MTAKHDTKWKPYIPKQPKPGEIKLKEFVHAEAQRLHQKVHTIEVRINRQRRSGEGEYSYLPLRHETKRTVWVRLPS